jgi:hypothetical protein
VVQSGPELAIRIILRHGSPPGWEWPARERLAKVDPLLAGVRMEAVDRLEQTIAGKTPMIIRRPSAVQHPSCAS